MKEGAYEIMRWQGIVALEIPNSYNPIIHNPKAIANLQYLDGKFCSGKCKGRVESALIVLLEMEIGKN